MTTRRMESLTCWSIIVLSFTIVATTPTHTHQHKHNKERIEDGAHHTHQEPHHSEFDHEAILGSVKEAQEFDHLSPEESKMRLAELVKKMDMNNDEFVDRHELKAWILRSFKTLSEEEALDRFTDLDVDQDDKVSWQEYLDDTYGMDNSENEIIPGAEKHTEEEKRLIADDKMMFEAADKNQDGVLVESEFTMFISPEEFPEMLPLILKQTLRDKDDDKDGKISFQEFIGDSAKHHDKEWLVVEKNKFDTDFDTDKDGVLNGNEILSWVVPSNDDVASEEVDHLFVSCDDNQDDRLSYDEIINNYEIFVGSEATDYGDHLQNIDNFRDEL